MPTRARLVHALGALALLLGSCAAPSHDADPHVDAAMEVGTGGDASATGLAAPLDQPAHPIVGGFVRTASPPSGLVPSCLIDTSLADFQAGVLTSCDATTTPGDVTLVVLPLLDQQNTTVTSNGFGFTATSWAGQTFVPTTSGPLNRIDLDLFCSGCSGTTPNIAVSVRATSGNPGVPTGADLATATIPGFNSSTGTYFTATFATPLTVTAGTQYAVVMRPVSNPSAGVYAYVCSCTTSTNPYAPGSRVTSSNSGASWTADVTAGGRDMGFSIYIGSGFVTSGTFASSVKDANPSSGETVHWTTLAWNATTPASTTLQFQVAPSNDPAGPFSFVGPDGTASTFFHSGDSLSQFDGNRYLEYQALFATSDTAQTAALQDVTTCFSNASSTVTTTLVVSPASAAFGATVDLTATLSATGSGLANRIVSFALNGTPVGGAITDAQGAASVTGVSLTGVEPGTYVGAVVASYDGEAGFTASAGSNDLTVSPAAQTLTFAALPNKLVTDPAFTLGATGGASGNPVTFTTSSVACSVSGTTVTLVSTGTCAIQADQAGNTEYSAAAPVTQSFTITLATQTITFPAITSFSWSGGSATLAATASSALTVAYSVSSGPCSVAGTTLTATSAGTCVVAANQAGNGSYSAAPQVTASAAVTTAGQAISFGALANKLMTDGAFSVSATGGASGNPVTFSTSSAACSVAGTTVTLVSAGTCAVQADQAGNANYTAAAPVTQSFTIARATQTITFPAITSFSWSGGSATLAATASSALT
ncbi:MAG: Ig-like domain repeat protein, partial [Kofleriaceae bacterium]